MEQIVWSEKLTTFRSLVENPSIEKPVLVQIGGKAIVVGEKIQGEFILASPCKVSGDRFEVMEQEIVVSSKHTGLWRVISVTNENEEIHIHRLTTKDIENIFLNDFQRERTETRSYVCIREVEAFEVIVHDQNDPTVFGGRQIERRSKLIEKNVEFEVLDLIEVEFTPSEGERTSQDFVLVPKTNHSVFFKLLLPGVVEEFHVVRNRVVKALHCRTKNEKNKRRFLLEVNEQVSEIRPVASRGSTELRYLHSTKNLFDFMANFSQRSMLYVKLIRGDPPIKAVEFNGYMILKKVFDGDRIPICRVSDLQITLVSPDLQLKVKLPAQNQNYCRTLSEVKAAEVECMQLSLALFARNESEKPISFQRDQSPRRDDEFSYNEQHRTQKKYQLTELLEENYKIYKKIFNNGENAKESNPKSTRSENSVQSATNLTRNYQRKSSSSTEQISPQKSKKNSSKKTNKP